MKYLKLIFILGSIIASYSAQGQVTLPYYDEMYSFRDGFTIIEVDNKCGIINDDLEEIIPPIFNDIKCYDYGPFQFKGMFFMCSVDSTFLYDTLGVLQKALYGTDIWPHEYYQLKNDYAFKTGELECSNNTDNVFSAHWGCSQNGITIIPYEFRNIYIGLSDHIIVRTANQQQTRFFRQNGDSLNNFYNIKLALDDDLSRYWIKSDKYYRCFDTTFSLIYTSEFEEIKDPKDSLMCVKINGKWGIVNHDFEIVLAPDYEDVRINDHWGYVKNNGLYGIINRKGELLTDIIYTTTGSYSQYITANSKITAYKGEQIIILDSNAKCIANCAINDSINKAYPNGKKWVEGNFEMYWKTGLWNYYRNDAENSIEKSVNYTDSLMYFTEYDSSGQVLHEYTDIRKPMITYR
ncbi:MAG: hypothetical protein GQ574_12845 [Crocinitomix sp.]|nr:hypothetical protein [Crocinitomix sp.]